MCIRDSSTPVPTKRTDENEIVKMMQTLFNIQNSKFDEKFNKHDVKFDEQSVKLDEIKNEIRKQNVNFDRQINENKEDKVSSGENYDNRSKNMVLENNCVSIESGDKSIMGVEFDSELIKSVDELERERKYRKNIQVGGKFFP